MGYRFTQVSEIQEHVGSITINFVQTPCVEDVEALVLSRVTEFSIHDLDCTLERMVTAQELLCLCCRLKSEQVNGRGNQPNDRSKDDDDSATLLQKHWGKCASEEVLDSIWLPIYRGLVAGQECLALVVSNKQFIHRAHKLSSDSASMQTRDN